MVAVSSWHMILRDPALQLDPRVQKLWALGVGLAALLCAAVTTSRRFRWRCPKEAGPRSSSPWAAEA